MAFFGAAATAAVDGEGLGLANPRWPPHLCFRGTLACGGVTAGVLLVQLLLEQE